MSDNIRKLLNGKVINPLNGEKISIPIKEIFIDNDILKDIPAFCTKESLGKKVTIVSDENTHYAAGAEIERLFCQHGFEVFSLVLPGDINPDQENIEILNDYILPSDFVVAVGSGTINDLVKYTTFKLSKNYISVPTAPSVNAYTSGNASINVEGVKKSLQAHLPVAVFMDVDVQVQAPFRLIISGVGDSLARSTSQADWLLSYHLLGTSYNPLPFDILKDDEKVVFDNAATILSRDYTAMKALCRLLILSGLGMYIAGSSMPASQGEHLIHHYMEMNFEGKYPHTYHGEQIAVATLTMAKLHQQILSQEFLDIDPTYYSEKPILKHFGKEKGKKFLLEVARKEITESRAKEINSKLHKEWPDIRKQISAISLSPDYIEYVLKSMKGPYTYKHLGWEHQDYEQAIKFCLFMRDRFTFLDLAMIMRRKLDS